MQVKKLLGNYAPQKSLDTWRGSNTGFFLGGGFPDYMLAQIKNERIEKTNPYSGMGMSDFSMVARAAFHFGFTGLLY